MLTHIIIASIITLVVLILAVWGWRRYAARHIVSQWVEEDEETIYAPLADVDVSVSIVVISEGGGPALEQLVPLLDRQSGVEKEIIVVDADDADSHGLPTESVVERLMTSYPHLRRTYVPHATNGLNPYDVATMLGTRAARHEWMVVVSPFFRPSSDEWLLDLMQYVDNTLSVVVDYANTADNEYLSSMERWRLRRQMKNTAKRGGAFETAGGAFIVQRDWFLQRLSRPVEGECLYLYTDPETRHRMAIRAHCR